VFSRSIISCMLMLLLGQAPSQSTIAQGFSPEASLRLGYIRNFQVGDQHSKLTLYPELEVSETIYQTPQANWTFLGSIYVGGWTESKYESCYCRNKLVFSQNSLVYGFRLSLVPRQYTNPLRFSLGISRHQIRTLYISTGPPRTLNPYETPFYGELGVELEQPVGSSIKLLVGSRVYRSLNREDPAPAGFRPSIHVGVLSSFR
jgi:hypothetical protein